LQIKRLLLTRHSWIEDFRKIPRHSAFTALAAAAGQHCRVQYPDWEIVSGHQKAAIHVNHLTMNEACLVAAEK
jgi:hypothetical protein